MSIRENWVFELASKLLIHRERWTNEGTPKGVRENMESNVVSIEQKRRLKKLKEKESTFKSYLSKLKQEQLQYEANYIINKVHEDDLSDEFLLKSALIMDELAKRVDAKQMSNTINKYSENIREKSGEP